MRGHDRHNQRPPHGYNPYPPGAQWLDAASTSGANPAAMGINPYAPYPQYAQNPVNLFLPHLHQAALQNQANLAAYYHHQQQQQQQQQYQYQPPVHSSPAYTPNPTTNSKRRPSNPPAAAAVPSPPKPPPRNQHAVLEKAQAATWKARDELTRARQGVTGCKVAQAALVALKADSWDSLGVRLHDVPLLRDLFLIEGKVNTFIHCYVAARKIVSAYDLEVEICKNQGVGQFEELGLGPFLHHPLVAHYFLVPADSLKVPKLTSEEIIKCLRKFMDSCKEKVTVENFLNYLTEQKSVSGKEKLGVRIKSLGLHISFLRQARSDEVAAVRLLGKTNVSGGNSCDKELPKFHLDKEELNERFDAITSRIKQLPGINKHINFDSTDDEIDGDTSSEDESANKDGCSILDGNYVDKRVNSCPYPSKTEEMERLGLKSEMSKMPATESTKVKESGKKGDSREKRKYEENGTPSSLGKPPKKRQKVQMEKQEMSPSCFLSTGKLEKFITTWKEACREHPIPQVLEMLANYYGENAQEKKKMIKFFSQYPGIGFLNVAVRSMGCGLLDSLYDLIHVVSESKSSSSPICNTTTEVMEIEPPSKKSAECIAKGANNANDEPGPNVTTDDVIRKITEHFESISGASGARTLQVGKFILLRTLHDCETWVTRQFSTKQFSCLGHGTFLEFLERHGRHLPPKLSSFLKGRDPGSSSVEVSVQQRQIEVLLWQAKGNWLKNGEFSEDGFCMLLKRQFPAICFDVEQNKSGEGLDGSIEGQGKNIHTDNITFSMSLLEKRWSGISPGDHDTVGGPRNGAVDQSYYSETISSREAINCLLRAPMLSDLLRWSHWDLLFAPSLGSFILWLLNTGPIQQLACIVTTDGRFVRVDPSATVDQFLEAIIQRSPFQVAVKLLSLLHIYNGSANTPISLLKCYAQRAIGIIMNNNNDLMSINSEGKTLMPGESHDLSAEQRDYSTRYTDCVQESSELSSARNITSDILTNIDSTIQFIAKFVLDCLGHLPSEFWNLAADILLAGLRTVTKNGYSAILREATETWQLCMLHDIGLSLGIAEWVEDYRGFCVSEEVRAKTELHSSSRHTSAASEGATLQSDNMPISHDVDVINDNSKPFPCKNDQVVAVNNKTESTLNPLGANADTAELLTNKLPMMGETNLEEAALVIETIRREEFGLDQALSSTENSLLKKQHARLGRALHCLSQELYSQDSHLLLELVQNADDNTYLEDVEPTLAFILQENGVVVLNNERGFSAENIRALCDIGNSTKKGSNRGYIGNKGIGFKSVFRVTDNPEIHSNGFHVKFDITEGQIGFVMPTAVPPYSVSSLSRMLSVEDDKNDCSFWNTCILLPFRSKFREGTGMCSIASMFADLHPSLLLFLHRLNCIKFKNVLNDTLLVMRRKALGDGIVRISHGNEIMSWLVASKKLEGTLVRHDVCTTEIAVAFTLQETGKGEYEPYLKQQPVFAFLPLRNYGLKFILQGDFVLPSSREEVDADNAWNQWLLSEFPSLFVSAQESFCALPCFQRCPGKAVTVFMSFVPLAGEVHGFFCKLPHLILSKLRLTRCMVLEGSSLQWAYPCNTLRGWDEQTRLLFSDGLLHEHLSLGYLSKDIIISDTLSRALGIHDYGLNVFIDIISSICRTDGCIESLGVEWLCAWFVTLHSILSHSSRNIPSTSGLEGDLLCALRKIPCIPLSDGSFSSVADDPIWLPHDILSSTPDCKSNMQDFPVLYSNLRIVSPYLLDLPCKNKYLKEEMRANDLMDILLKVGVRKLSGHEIIKNHILGSFSNGTDANMSNKMMIEYVRFIMLHLQSSCTSCRFEKEDIVSELRRRPILLTNHGYKYPADEPIHFSREYGSSVDISKLLHNVEFRWIELDSCYLMNHGSDSLPSMLKKWRLFFEEMGVTEFVQVVRVEKNIPQVDSLIVGSQLQRDISGTPSTVYDWESQELASILSTFSSKKCRENCVYLLEVLDNLWGDYYGAKAWSVTNVAHGGETKTVESSFMNCIRSFKWIASSMDDDLHYATDLFCDSENVRSLLGSVAPYAVPQISSRSLRKDIGFKTNVSHRDALMILNLWVASQVPFSASMDQMCKFYTFVSEGAAQEKIDIKQEFVSCSSIFTPLLRVRSGEVIPGKFLSPKDLYWHDPTGCSEMTEDFVSIKKSMFPRRMLSATYPNLCEFFTETCGVQKVPATSDYVGILLRLSNAALPSQVANHVFRVFVRWADDLQSASDKMNDIIYLKESLQKLETTILPILVDKWVSLHPSFGLICWVDDDDLKQHFKNSSHVDFIQFGELSYEDKQMLHGRVAALMKSLGIPALSKVVHREAIFDGTAGNKEKATLICGLLPYMQRYIYAMHRDTYMNFQQNEMGKLSNLQVIVVEELFHKYVLKGRESSSKRKFKCHCLLQGNNLYATKEADSHSVLLELSRLFFDGSSDLHFANFLLMVKTMVESGTTAEQIESFIVNNQSVPELPEHEAVWSFSPLIVGDHIVDSETVERVAANETNIPKHQITEGTVSSPKPQKAEGSVSSWPPTDWNTAPSFGTSRRSQHRPPQETKVNHPGHGEDTWPPVELEGDWVIEEGMGIQNTLLTESTVATLDEPQMMMSVNSAGAPEYLDLETGDLPSEIVDAEVIDFSDKMSKVSEERERLRTGAPDLSQSKRTGKLGEYIVHRHFVEQLGASNVVWVNEESESGLPYDVVITRGENSKEYVEVKATIASSKSWFYITAREWQFALEQGDSFSIARVVLVRGKKASIIMLKNPHKLCQKKECQLALFMAG